MVWMGREMMLSQNEEFDVEELKMINENLLAKAIIQVLNLHHGQTEGKKVQVNIDQAKEVLRTALDILALNFKMSEIVALVEKHLV